jgi:hypothetical protein
MVRPSAASTALMLSSARRVLSSMIHSRSLGWTSYQLQSARRYRGSYRLGWPERRRSGPFQSPKRLLSKAAKSCNSRCQEKKMSIAFLFIIYAFMRPVSTCESAMFRTAAALGATGVALASAFPPRAAAVPPEDSAFLAAAARPVIERLLTNGFGRSVEEHNRSGIRKIIREAPRTTVAGHPSSAASSRPSPFQIIQTRGA